MHENQGDGFRRREQTHQHMSLISLTSLAVINKVSRQQSIHTLYALQGRGGRYLTPCANNTCQLQQHAAQGIKGGATQHECFHAITEKREPLNISAHNHPWLQQVDFAGGPGSQDGPAPSPTKVGNSLAASIPCRGWTKWGLIVQSALQMA